MWTSPYTCATGTTHTIAHTNKQLPPCTLLAEPSQTLVSSASSFAGLFNGETDSFSSNAYCSTVSSFGRLKGLSGREGDSLSCHMHSSTLLSGLSGWEGDSISSHGHNSITVYFIWWHTTPAFSLGCSIRSIAVNWFLSLPVSSRGLSLSLVIMAHADVSNLQGHPETFSIILITCNLSEYIDQLP